MTAHDPRTQRLAYRARRGLGADAVPWHDDLCQTIATLRLAQPQAHDGSLIYQARRQLLDWMGLARQQRHHHRSVVAIQAHADATSFDHLADSAPSPAWILSQAETTRLVRRVLNSLPPHHSQLLREHLMEGKPVNDQAARALGLRSRHQLRSRLLTSMEVFRAALKKTGVWNEVGPIE